MDTTQVDTEAAGPGRQARTFCESHGHSMHLQSLPSLAKALGCIAKSGFSEPMKWEVIVVDNNSSDQTREVVDEFRTQFGDRLRYVFEPQQGLSCARNAGIREARGEILAFTDDDVTVEPAWLGNLSAALNDKKWAGLGGRTLPRQPFSLPAWLSPENPQDWGGIVGGIFDLGNEPRELACPPYGANMAFRKAMFDKYGGFRTDLGRSGGVLMSNEDIEFGRRLMEAGEHLLYEPSAVAYHPILENRLRKEYFLRWWFNFGRARIIEAGPRPGILGIPRHYISIPNNLLRVLPLQAIRWLFAPKPQKRFHYKCLAWATAGTTTETWRRPLERWRPEGNDQADLDWHLAR